MSMLKSITLENYKCFKNETEIKIAPLTILCGVNSSGKSSIINSLLLQKQSYEDSSISNSLKLNGEYVKCGRFDDISFKKKSETVNIKTSYELYKPLKYKQGATKQSKYDITSFKNLAKIYPFDVKYFKICSNISIKKSVANKYVNDNILYSQNIVIQVIGLNGNVITSSIDLRNLQDAQYAIELSNIPKGETGELVESIELHDATCYFENFNLINAFSTNIKPRGTQVSEILANVYLIFKMNTLQYKNIHYLTPLRVYPQRNYVLDYDNEDVGVSGEHTPYIMYQYKDKNIDGFLPPENDVINKNTKKINFVSCVQKWMKYLQFGNYTLPTSGETIQLNISDYNISNVGFGISQVLPIIVSGLIKNENELLLLEQPEIHLHPSAQMSMADYLISMALNGKGLIVETHSDHIINRIVRRIMENDTICKNTKIYFVDQNNEGISNIEEIVVDKVRGVMTTNKNFFTQFASETEKIIRTGFENKHKEG